MCRVPHCGEQQTRWDNLRWPKERPEEAVYHCADCGAGIEEHHKTRLLAAGRWVAPIPSARSPASTSTAWYTPTGLWLHLGRTRRAVGETQRPGADKTFVNLRLGEVVADPNEKLSADDLGPRQRLRHAHHPARLPGADRRNRRAEGPLRPSSSATGAPASSG